MQATLEAESTLTDRYQTTVPETVRRALKLSKRDKLRYAILATGEVTVSRAQPASPEDPALAAFLAFLARDITEHPERLEELNDALIDQIRSLTAGVSVDLNAPLSPDDE